MKNFFGRNCLAQEISRRSAALLLTAALVALAGCGSGSGLSLNANNGGGSSGGTSGIAQTITGTAATGAPLAGATVTVEDSTGKTAKGTTAADGTFAVAVTGMTPPFMLVAVPTSGSNLYSVLPAMDMSSTNTQNVNITPVTTLVMYELNAGADPASMYNSLTFASLTAAAVTARETIVRGKLPMNAVNPIFSTMYGKFIAQAGGNDPYDAALDALGRITAISPSGVTLATAAGSTTTYISSGGTPPAGPSLSLKLTDPATGATVTSISSTSPAKLIATVTNGSGAGVPNTIVTFSTDPLFGAFSGGANTALTDASGVASVTLTTLSTSGGAATVKANASVGGTAVTAEQSYAIGTSNITLSAITVPAGILSAYGTASVNVNVLNNNQPYSTPMAVKFTSICAASGKATLTPTVTSVNGTASATYLDNGCNNPTPGDSITATLSNGASATGNLPVNSPNVGSIQFVSVATTPATTPPTITLKGTGGLSRSETARVTFRVVDSAGNPIGSKLVNFSLNTSQGGLSLSAASATSDPITGYAITNVQAGTVGTVVRVTAKTGDLSTQSDQLVVSTGIPAQDAISLSPSTLNIEGLDYDGAQTTLTVRMADHFHNPVPDGTAVYFTAEGGAVSPSCTTVGGVCTATFTSQALRPSNGRVTVLARAIGEQAFTDLNGDGVVSSLGEMIDANGASTDIGDAFVDYNENGVRDLNEPYFDFAGKGYYTSPRCLSNPQYSPACPAPPTAVGDVTHPSDGLYRGLLCNGDPAVCSSQKSIDVRAQTVIVFSGSDAVITINGGMPIALPPCTLANGAGAPLSFTVNVADRNGNAMPAGTTIVFSTDNGIITSETSKVVLNTAELPEGYLVTMNSDVTYTPANATTDPPTPAACSTNVKPSGTFTVKVATPNGRNSTRTATVTD